MKLKRNSFFPVASLAFGSVVIALSSSTALAQTDTWDGGGADNNWGTALNWADDSQPATGTASDLFFDGSLRPNPVNNYTAFDDFRNITFNSGASAFTVSGSAIDLFGKIENLSVATQTVNLATIALNSASANEFNPVNGNLAIGSASIVNNGNQLKVFGDNGFSLTFGTGSDLSGLGSVAINQNSNVVYQSAHTYVGDTFVNAGSLQFAPGGSANSSIIRLGDTIANSPAATVSLTDFNGGTTVASTIVVRPSASGTQGTRTISGTNTSGTNTFSGPIALDTVATITSTTLNSTLAFTGTTLELKTFGLLVNGAGITTMANAVTSTGAGNSLTKSGTGTLTFSGGGAAPANTYTGLTTVNEGTLQVSRFTVTPAGTPAPGTGTITSNISVAGNLTIGDGVGIANSATVQTATAIISANGPVGNPVNQIADTAAVTINSDGRLRLWNASETIASLTMNGGSVDIGGANSNFNTFGITGATTLSGGASLVGSGGNHRFFFGGNISTSGDSTVSVGSSSNSTFDFGGGNKTITVADGASAIDLQFGSTGGTGLVNYRNGSATKAGAGLMEVKSGSFGVGAGFTGWTVDAGTMRMGSALVLGALSPELQITTVNGGILDLQTFAQNSRGGVVLTGGSIIGTTGTITVASGNSFDVRSGTVSGIFAGAGAILTKTTAGTVTLSGANTYTGGTNVQDGILLVNNLTGSGTGTGAVAVASGASFGGSGTISNTATLASGAKLAFNLSTNAAGHDKLDLGGLVNSGTTTVVITSSGGASPGTYVLATSAGGVTGAGSISSTPVLPGGWAGTVAVVGNNVELTLTSTGGGSSAYDTWAGGTYANPFTNTAPGVDFDNDGLENLMEFVLGGDPTTSQSGIAPTVAASGTALVITFRRSDASELQPVAVKVQVSADLATWNPASDIPIGAASNPGPIGAENASYTLSNSGGFDTITVTIPKAAATKKFARVVATD